MRAVKARAPEPVQSSSLRIQPVYAQIPYRQQPISRAAAIKQAKGRYFSTAARASGLCRGTNGAQTSRIASAVNRLTSRSPFASTLRPNVTGGTLCRTAGGYAIGAGRLGGVRYFSNSPACPAQVVQNVSAAVRAFWLSGQRARFDGVDPITGVNKYRAVTALQDEAARKMDEAARAAPGSYIDFRLSPTVTALGCFETLKQSASVSDYETPSLNTPGVLDMLAGDFARALMELAAVLNDLKLLSTLGDLPLSVHGDSSILRVRFPGCDAESVERLCAEVGVKRGVIHQDKDFEARNGTDMALLFPFAPSHVTSSSPSDLFYFHEAPPYEIEPVDWRGLMSSSGSQDRPSPGLSGQDYQLVESLDRNPWTRSPSGYSSMDISELGDRQFFPDLPGKSSTPSAAMDYEGIEGIYKFIEECDRARQ